LGSFVLGSVCLVSWGCLGVGPSHVSDII
jgi:hypothetical protein